MSVATDAPRGRYARVKVPGVVDEVETVWQRPAGHDPPKGLFFIAHGCNHQGTDIFPSGGTDGLDPQICKQSNVGGCFGLPEEVRLRHAALARGYLVMAVSGGTGHKSCWHSGDERKVRGAIQYVLREEKLAETTSVLATGASSGGRFMGQLALPVEKDGIPNLKCIVPEVMDIDDLDRDVPTLFIHMPKDTSTAMAVKEVLDDLKEKGTRRAELLVTPVPVTAVLLQQCMSEDLATEVVKKLRTAKVVDEGGFLISDAREREWVPPLNSLLPKEMFTPDEGCLAELMNVAFAFHEFTSEHAEMIFDFCEGVGDYSDVSDAARLRGNEVARNMEALSSIGYAAAAGPIALDGGSSKPIFLFASIGFVIITAAGLIRLSGRGALAKGRADRASWSGQKHGQ